MAILDEEALLAISVYICAGRLIRQEKASISAELAGIFERLNCSTLSRHKRMESSRRSIAGPFLCVHPRAKLVEIGERLGVRHHQWSTFQVVHFDDTIAIRRLPSGCRPFARQGGIAAAPHIGWTMVGEVRLDLSPQPDKNG